MALVAPLKKRNLVSLPVLTGFCLLVDCLKYLKWLACVEAANRYDASLAFGSANGVFVFQAALLTLGRNKKPTQRNCGCR